MILEQLGRTDATADEIPSLLTQDEKQQAVDDGQRSARGHRQAPHRQRPRVESWKSASLSREKPSKGVFTATYDQYRTATATRMSSTRQAGQALGEEEQDLPTSEMWSVDEKNPGR